MRKTTYLSIKKKEKEGENVIILLSQKRMLKTYFVF